MFDKQSFNFGFQRRFLAGFIALIVITLSLQNTGSSAALPKKWRQGYVQKVVDNNHLILFTGETIEISGIEVPDLLFPEKSEECFSRFIFRALKALAENKEIKWKEVEHVGGEYFRAQVKVKNETGLTEFMLENGMGRVSENTDEKQKKKYEALAKTAKEGKSGIWGECSKDSARDSLRSQGYFGGDFRKRYASFLAPISVGKVREVLSGDVFVLENDLRVRLLGMETPSPSDNRSGFQCFGKASRDHLSELILGKTVYIKKDFSQFNDDRELLRYVYLPLGGKRNPEIFINERMISDGFARSFWPRKDSYFKEKFEEIQKEVYSSSRGAWSLCINEILNK